MVAVWPQEKVVIVAIFSLFLSLSLSGFFASLVFFF